MALGSSIQHKITWASDEDSIAWHVLELGDMLHVTKRKTTRKGREGGRKNKEGRREERSAGERLEVLRCPSKIHPQRLNKDALLKGPHPFQHWHLEDQGCS